MKANATPVFKKRKKEDLKTYRPANFSMAPENMLEQLILEITSKQPGVDDGAEYILRKFAHDIKLGGVAEVTNGCVTFQKELGRLEKMSCGYHMRFNKGKGQVLPLGRNYPMCQ
ncbi:hypothetical protein BTVI_16122 [Pitangus sulphuratus]|nr:hypothetical protein BTVI_16122 [Pitangus sulphuratus]